MAPRPGCAGNCPTPKPPWPSGRRCSTLSPTATTRSAPGCCWRIISKNSPCRARISPATIGGRASSRPAARSGWKKRPFFFCAPAVRCPPSCCPRQPGAVCRNRAIGKGAAFGAAAWNTGFSPARPAHLDAPRATLRVVCEARPAGRIRRCMGWRCRFTSPASARGRR